MKPENYKKYQEAKNIIKEKKHNEAILLLEQIIEEEPEDIYVKFELAKLLIKKNETKQQGRKGLG